MGLMGIGTFTQIHGISSAISNFFQTDTQIHLFGNGYSLSTVIAGIAVTLFAGLVIIGGIKRIAGVSQVVVPFMAVLYLSITLFLLIVNFQKIPGALLEIFQGAFGLKAAAGGAMGAMVAAMQKGVARGIFSNESGLGSAPIAAAAAQTNEPARQGLVSMTGTFIDTIIICTMTGLSIVITGSWNVGLEGVAVTTRAFQVGLPLPDQLSAFLLMLCLVFFAFTTILGWNYYSERCLEYLLGKKPFLLKLYRWIYILAIFIGPYMTISAVWNIADIFNGLMAFPNLIALIALSPVVAKETQLYLNKIHQKKENLEKAA